MGTSWKHIIFVNLGLKKNESFRKVHVLGTMFVHILFEILSISYFEYIIFISYFTKMRIGK